METTRELKRVLVFIDWFTPGYKAGGPVRSMVNMIDHLAGNFAFDVVTRNTEYMESVPYPNVMSNQWNSIAPNVRVWYASSEKESITTWRKLIATESYNSIYINGIYSLKYSILPLLAAKMEKHSHIIVAPRGMLAPSAINVKRGKKELFLKMGRAIGLYNNVLWHTTNEKESSEVKSTFGASSKTATAANLPRKQQQIFKPIAKQPGELSICSFARISPEKNTLFALQSLKSIKTDSKITFHLYGQIYNQEYWQQCLEEINTLPANISAVHKGVVTADEVGANIANYHIMYLPSRGENFGHVILESLMAARPVLISDQTPWRNLEAKKCGWDLPLDDMEGFTQVIENVTALKQEEFEVWCDGALSLAREFVNDKDMVQKYVGMLA